MRKFAIAVVLLACAGIASAQMDPDEALQKLHEREAAAAQPTDQTEEIATLKSIVADQKKQIDLQKSQIESYRRLLPEIPQKGWNFNRVRIARFARVLDTGDVFNVQDNGSLQAGTSGTRIVVTVDTPGLPDFANGGETQTTVTHQHRKIPQVALYNVFVNNNTPYDPSLGADANIKQMTDAYVVLVNVDSGFIDFVDRNDQIWDDIFASKPKEETTIIMQQTLIIHTETSGE